MKRLLFLIMLVLCMTSALLSWQYSTQTTWQGTEPTGIWQSGNTVFTPGSTPANMRLCSPTSWDCYSGPCGSGHAQWWFTEARLHNAADNYTCNKECGGNCLNSGLTVSTTLNYTLTASFDWRRGYPLKACGPATVYAYSPNSPVSCSVEGPGGE